MSYELFWYESADIYWAYQTAFVNKSKRELEEYNYKAWLQGLYFYNAISVGLSNSNRDKQSDPIQNYVDKPFDFKQQENEVAKEEKKVAMDNQMRVFLANYKSKLDRKNKNNKKE